MSILQELKEICNKIVGSWYCEQTKELFVFDLNDKLLHESRLRIVTEKKSIETIYGVAVKIDPDITKTQTQFYFDIGKFDKRYYHILNITKDLLVLNEFFMVLNVPPSPHLLMLKRITDPSVADDILAGIDLG